MTNKTTEGEPAPNSFVGQPWKVFWLLNGGRCRARALQIVVMGNLIPFRL